MLSAIGSSIPTSTAGTGTSTAGLEAQLDKYQIQLADWVNCPSHKTPEGKAKIKDISDKVSEIEQRIKTAESAKRSSSPTVIAANTFTSNNRDKVLSTLNLNDKLYIGNYPTLTQPTVSVGSRLDVYA